MGGGARAVHVLGATKAPVVYAVPAGVRTLPSGTVSHLRPPLRVAAALVRRVREGARRCARPDVQASQRLRPQATDLWHSQRGATAALVRCVCCDYASWSYNTNNYYD